MTQPEHKAREILMLRDGAMVAGYLADDTDAVVDELSAALRRVIAAPPP